MVDICTYLGTLGLFFTAFLLFIRWIPMIAIAEVKGVMPEADPHHDASGHAHEGLVGNANQPAAEEAVSHG
jgi:molybdopterin-containing oxidoreductase family membrane subunit